ncbi:MAG: sugar phosphate isomerase/epimerase [Gemmataceae bacterium]|nr:sugar phosphate isomerase/epimerase [Gemmataceae bacterium]
MHRRTFLASLLAAPAALAIDPIKREGKPNLAASLAAYSYSRYLALGGKMKPTMTLEDFIDQAAKMELKAVELTAYYFKVTTKDYVSSLRKRCEKHGLAVSGTAVGNDFCWPDEKKLAEQMGHVKKWVEVSASLGAKTMRIFAGSVKKGDMEADAVKRAVDKIEEACEFAAKHKVILALENHGGITATPEQLLALVKPIRSEWFGVNLDTGNFQTPDPYGDLEKCAPYAVTVQLKTEVFPKGKREDADIGKIAGILRAAGYQGYVALEYEAKEDPRTAVPKHVKELMRHMG